MANVLGMIVAESAIGKDVGGLLERVAQHYGWLIGSAGSEEGIADAYIAKPNGLLTISEFASRIDLDTGFLGRFLVTEISSSYFGCPAIGDLTSRFEACKAALDTLRAKDCDVIPLHGYNRELAALFLDGHAEPGSAWWRLVNEYYPRFAAFLSVAPGDTSPQIELTADAWRRAGVLVQYFFAQAESILTDIYDDEEINRFEALCRRILRVIRDRKSSGASLNEIHEICGKGTRSKDRRSALNELLQRGLIRSEKQGKKEVFHVR